MTPTPQTGLPLLDLLVALNRDPRVRSRFESDAPGLTRDFGLDEAEMAAVRDGDSATLRQLFAKGVGLLLDSSSTEPLAAPRSGRHDRPTTDERVSNQPLLELFVDSRHDPQLAARLRSDPRAVAEAHRLDAAARLLLTNGDREALFEALVGAAEAILAALIALSATTIFAPYPGRGMPTIDQLDPTCAATPDGSTNVFFEVTGTGFGRAPILILESPGLTVFPPTLAVTHLPQDVTIFTAEDEIPVGNYSAKVENTNSGQRSNGVGFEVVNGTCP